MKKQVPPANREVTLFRSGEPWAAKLYSSSGEGERARPTWFTTEVVAPSSAMEWVYLLERLERDPYTAPVRGSLTEFASELRARGIKIRRRSTSSKGTRATLFDKAKAWVGLDFDKLDPHMLGIEPPTSDRERIEALRLLRDQHLPTAFQGVEAAYQWSASHGRKEGLCVHLFFILSQPIASAPLRQWLRRQGVAALDVNPINAATPLYCSGPRYAPDCPHHFSGTRQGLLEGERPAVNLSGVVITPTPKQRLRGPTMRTQVADSGDRGEAALERACSIVTDANSGTRHTQLLSIARWIGGFVEAGHLDGPSAFHRLLNAAHACGLGEREARGAISWGLANPSRLNERDEPTKPRLVSPPPSERADALNLEEDPKALQRLIFQQFERARAGVWCLSSPPAGAGKTHSALAAALAYARQGRAVVYSVPTHGLAEEAAQRLEERLLSTDHRPRILKGILRRGCAAYERATDHQRIALRAAASYGRRALCGDKTGGCAFWSTCEARHQPTRGHGMITFAPHALIPHLELDNTLLIVDEAPAFAGHVRISVESLKTLAAPSLDAPASPANTWRRRADANHAIEALCEGLLKIPQAGDWKRYPERVEQSAIRELWASVGESFASLSSRIQEGGLTSPPHPSANHLHTRFQLEEVPSREAWRVVCLLARASLEEWPPSLSVWTHQGVVWIERRWALSLPTRCPVVILDATGTAAASWWRGIAERCDARMELDDTPIQGRHTEGVWFKTGQLTARRLYTRQGKRIEWRESASGSFKTVARALEEAWADVPSEVTVGVGASKPVADLLRAALASESPNPLVNSLVQVFKRFRAVEVGHTGRDDRGTNRFERVAAFALFGAPRPSLSAALADADLLDLPQSATDELTRAAMLQWFGRPRTLRRSGVRLFYAGAMTPAQFPNIHWRQVEVEVGRPQATGDLERERARLEAGETVLRVELHERYGRRGGDRVWRGLTSSSDVEVGPVRTQSAGRKPLGCRLGV